MTHDYILWATLLLPLLAGAVIPLFTFRHRELSARISIAAIVISFWLSVFLWFSTSSGNQVILSAFSWLSLDQLEVSFGVRLDRLSLLMLLVVTSVAGAIHIYSYDYMRGDAGISRFFACLSFFTFSMLGVVLSNNFLQIFIFWELVGVSSYFLISFWHTRPSAADAGLKAFVVNRLGDFGFLLGIIILWRLTGSLDFEVIAERLNGNPRLLGELSTLVGVLIFCGAMGKSAQFPLHVWLPDAMEGPTPVSALIHAATMVAAGIYMLCRVYFVFEVPPQWPEAFGALQWITAPGIIATAGAITALLAALMALQQNDIKRILAYSTLSQLGYMIMAVGLGGYSQAMFHLTTHAFFKALLFLGAGAVILGLHHEQDIWKMGGVRHKMRLTFATFLLGALAIAGVPPLSGFFSKDAILAVAYHENLFLFVLGVVVSALTAFYMFRLVFVVFFGPVAHEAVKEAHEASRIMTQPMLFLTIPAVTMGLWGIDAFLEAHFNPARETHGGSWVAALFEPFAHAPVAAFASVGAFVFGIYAAFVVYHGTRQDELAQRLGPAARLLRRKFYIDEFYDLLVRWTQEALAKLANAVDRWIIAGLLVRGSHGTVEFTGRVLRLAQTGNLQTYAFYLVAGVVIIMIWVLGS